MEKAGINHLLKCVHHDANLTLRNVYLLIRVRKQIVNKSLY